MGWDHIQTGNETLKKLQTSLYTLHTAMLLYKLLEKKRERWTFSEDSLVFCEDSRSLSFCQRGKRLIRKREQPQKFTTEKIASAYKFLRFSKMKTLTAELVLMFSSYSNSQSKTIHTIRNKRHFKVV